MGLLHLGLLLWLSQEITALTEYWSFILGAILVLSRPRGSTSSPRGAVERQAWISISTTSSGN